MPGSDGGDITRCPHTSSPCQYWPASPLLMSQHCTAHLAASIPSTLSHANIVVVSSLGCDNVSVEDRLQVTLEANTVQCYQLSASANVAPVPRVSPPIAACHNKTETSITMTANCKYKRLINSFMGAF